ncbi:MAG: MlaD family protein [Planctomycetota bacterium]|nr:MlaD family protein [Planctomycetota bacterium]
MPQNSARNHVVAGAFLLVALAAAVTVLVLVGGWDAWNLEMQTLNVRFKAAPNVKIGCPVLLAGHPVGSVEKTQLVESPCPVGDKRPTCYMVQVTVSLEKQYAIHKDARIMISQALVGSSAVINIEDVGVGEKVTDFVMGGEASPFAAAAGEVGIGDKERQSVGEIIEDIRVVTASLKTELPAVVEKVKAASADLADGSKKAKETVAEMKEILDENRENVKTAIANTKGATENVVASTQTIQQIVTENRDEIHQTIVHARSIAENADKEAASIVANVKATSVDVKAAMADFKVIAGDTKALISTNRGNIATTLQNFRETSDHLLALSKEVRRAPWRLFATPDKKEVESLNLYDSARAFASAATDIQTCADTLQVMIEARKNGVDVNVEFLQGMEKRLEETFARYQEAEKALMKEFERIGK